MEYDDLDEDEYDPSYTEILDDDASYNTLEVQKPVMSEQPIKPSWRNCQAPREHRIKFVDSSGNENTHIIRADTLDGILLEVRKFNTVLAGTKARNKPSGQAKPVPVEPRQKVDTDDNEEESPEFKPCPVHPDMTMKRRPSRDGGYFYSHQIDGAWCNGRVRR